MDNEARLIKLNELKGLLNLYKYLHEDDPVLEDNDKLKELWEDIYKNPNLYYIVISQGNLLVSSCTLAVIKNLTRGARPYGLIENVITHPDYRQRGLGSKVIQKAVDICKENNCYKILLLTGSKKESVFRFYEKAGFERGIKTGFCRKL